MWEAESMSFLHEFGLFYITASSRISWKFPRLLKSHTQFLLTFLENFSLCYDKSGYKCGQKGENKE